MYSVVAAASTLRLYHVQRVKRASTRVKSTYEASYTVAWHASSPTDSWRDASFVYIYIYLFLSLPSVEEILIRRRRINARFGEIIGGW